MQPNLDELNKKIEENRDFIDRIAIGIPGFKGYVEKSEKYDADSMLREIIADKIRNLKKELGILSSDLVKKSELEPVQEIDSLSNIIEGILKKVEYADYGLKGPFSKIEFSEENQNRLLEFDWRLISQFDEIEKILTEGKGNPSSMLETLKTQIREYEKLVDDRKYVILEVI